MKKISSLEYNTILWFLTRATFIEITCELILSKSHQDSWISILLAIFIGLIPFTLYNKLKNKYPNQNIITINQKLGKIGTLLNLISIAGIFIFTLSSFWIVTNFIDSQYLYKTPTIFIIIILILPVLYTITKKFHVFSKVSLIMFFTSLIFIIIILIGLVGNVNIDNIKPILNNSKENILISSFYFIGFNILPLFLLNIIPKNKIKNYSSKKSYLFYFISTLSLLNVIFLTISIFGIHLAELYHYPSFHLLKRVSVLDIIDRIESILSLEWFLALFVQIIMGLYFIKEGLKEIFKIKEKTNNTISIVTCLIIIILTQIIFKTAGSSNAYFKNELIYILYLTCFILPLITFLISKKSKFLNNQNSNNPNNT